MLSPFTGLAPEQAAQVEALVDHVYDDFLDKVGLPGCLGETGAHTHTHAHRLFP